MKKTLFNLALMLTIATAAHAEFETGNSLLSKMDGSLINQSLALGYIMGAHDASRGIYQCSPAGATAGQVKDITHQYLGAYPQVRHLSADAIVIKALMITWPCPAAKKSGVAL